MRLFLALTLTFIKAWKDSTRNEYLCVCLRDSLVEESCGKCQKGWLRSSLADKWALFMALKGWKGLISFIYGQILKGLVSSINEQILNLFEKSFQDNILFQIMWTDMRGLFIVSIADHVYSGIHSSKYLHYYIELYLLWLIWIQWLPLVSNVSLFI